MAIGLAGDSQATVGGDPVTLLSLLEARVISNLLQAGLLANGGQDDLNVLRNDQAFELGVAMPVPGSFE